MLQLLTICVLINRLIINSHASTHTLTSGEGVYGISRTLQLVQFDINSGKKTIVNDGPGKNYFTGETLNCFDNVNNIFYILVSTVLVPLTAGLYGFNLSNPSQDTGFIELPQIYAASIGGAGEQCLGDPNNGNIYVFGHSALNKTEQLLLNVYRNSSNISDIIIETVNTYSNIDDVLLIPGEMTIFDSKRNKMWIPGQGKATENYYYIDAKTGEIENKIPYKQFPIYASGYDNKLDQIVGISYNGSEPDDEIKYIMKYADPVTLNITNEFEPIKEWCFWTAEGSIDDENQIWYNLLFNDTETPCQDYNGSTPLNQYLVGVNITSGQLVTDPAIGADIIWDLFYWNGE
eukprot:502974_1